MRVTSKNPAHASPTVSAPTPKPVQVAKGQSLDLQAMASSMAFVQGPASKNKSSYAEKNAAILGNVVSAYEAPDPAARGFAKAAIDATLLARADSAKRQTAGDDRVPSSPEGRFLQLAKGWIRSHHAIAEGYDESLKSKPAEVVAERQKLSKAILSDIAQRLLTEVPIETAFRRMPEETAALLAPKTPEAQKVIAQRIELSKAQREVDGILDMVASAFDRGFDASTVEKRLLGKAREKVESSPQEAFDTILDVAKRAKAWLDQPHPPKVSKEQLAEIKKKAKEPQLTSEQKFQKGLDRVAELEAEIAGATSTPTLESRFRGAMLGLAIGDALGGPTEFMDRAALREQHGLVADMIGGGWLHLAPGEYTDDTQMAESMAKSIVEKGGLDVQDLTNRYVAWLNSDPKDVGGLTRQTLELARIGVDPESAGRIPWALSGFENAGNGSVMRAAPVAMLTAFKGLEEIESKAMASSSPTHADPRCLYGTAAISLATSLVLQGEADVLPKVVEYLKDRNADLANAIAKVPEMALEDVRTSGYVVDTVQAAFWALYHAQSYVDGIVAVTNLGEDTDTAGATAGILLGAKFGVDGIPESWRSKLQNAQGLSDLADKLRELAGPAKEV